MSDVIAVVFDFDDTLLPDSTTLLLESRGIDPDKFWKIDAKNLLDQGFDPTLAYLNLILENIGPDKPFGNLRSEDLRAFGKTLDNKFFPGRFAAEEDLGALLRAAVTTSASRIVLARKQAEFL